MRRIGIEAFLAWAYRDELPKAGRPGDAAPALGFGGGWEAVSRQGELMAETVSDGRPNAYGVVPLGAVYGADEPHPDALAAHAAVIGLGGLAVAMPEGWAPLADLGLTDEEATAAVGRAWPQVRRLARQAGELARRFAILGGEPDWRAEPPKRRLVEMRGRPAWFRRIGVAGAFGEINEMEVDGYDARAGRPYPDAYRRTELHPDPALVVVDRAEYEVWRAALTLIVGALEGRLSAHVVTDCAAPARPWESCVETFGA